MASEGLFQLTTAIVLEPRGMESLKALTGRVTGFTLAVPIVVAISSISIVTWQLMRLDPIAIIERRD